MNPILIIRNLNLLAQLKGERIVVETDNIELIKEIKDAVLVHNFLFCIIVRAEQMITKIAFKKEWKNIPLVIYPNGLGAIDDLIAGLPLIKKLNVKFFLNGAKKENCKAVQTLSSLGIYSGIVIDENADWEKLTGLMNYTLCEKVMHAPIEPFQFVYEMYNRNVLVDYGRVFFDDSEQFVGVDEAFFCTEKHRGVTEKHRENRQRFFYEPTTCAACEGWRICLGKYAALEDKSGCQKFMANLLIVVENLRFEIRNS